MNPLVLQAYEEATKVVEKDNFEMPPIEDVLSLLSDHGIDLSRCEEEQWQQHDSILEECNSQIDKILHLHKITTTHMQTNRLTMESLENIFPSVINQMYPPATYTSSMSEHQLEQSLEAIDLGAILSVAVLVAAVAMLFYALYKKITDSTMSSTVSKLNNNYKKLQTYEKDLKANISAARAKRDTETDKMIQELDKMADELLASLDKANSNVSSFIKAITPNGSISNLFSKINKDLPNKLDKFKNDAEKLATLTTDNINDKKDKAGIKADLLKLKSNFDVSFVDDVDKLLVTIKGITGDTPFKAYMTKSVFGTDEHYKLYTNDTKNWYGGYSELVPNDVSSLDNKLKQLKSIGDKLKLADKLSKAKVEADKGKDLPPKTQDEIEIIKLLKEINNEVSKVVKAISKFRDLNEQALYFYQYTSKLKADYLRKQGAVVNKLKSS